VKEEKYIVVGTALIVLRMMAQYCALLHLFPQCVSELLLNAVELLKNFNSRTCQLILGAGALQLIGLKTISVKHMALAARCLQLIAHFIPTVRSNFETNLPSDRQQQLRYFDQTLRDYNDHLNEINSKLLTVVDQHLITSLNEWELKPTTPSPTFQHIVRQIGKFYNGYASLMPQDQTAQMLLRVHQNFKRYLKEHLVARQITPHDSLTYGHVAQDFLYYVENMRAFPGCEDFPEDTLNDV
jgi:vacuolar protein sorting-associated protein 54